MDGFVVCMTCNLPLPQEQGKCCRWCCDKKHQHIECTDASRCHCPCHEERKCCGEWSGKEAYDCNKDGARTKPGVCDCKCHKVEAAAHKADYEKTFKALENDYAKTFKALTASGREKEWEKRFDAWAKDAFDTFTNEGNTNHYLSDAECYEELKARIRTIEQEAYERGKRESIGGLGKARGFGKNTIALANFFHEGKKGKAVVFATPDGDFLSPKAVENRLAAERFRIESLIGGMKYIEESGGWSKKDSQGITISTTTNYDFMNGYNAALSAVLEKIKNS